MKSAKEAVTRGFDDFHAGRPFSCSPYFPTPAEHQVVMGYHGVKEIGRVRIDFDQDRLWEIGWNVAEMMETEKRRAVRT